MKNKGFTLIEMLIAVFIFSVLFIIGMTFFAAHRKDIRNQKATQEQEQVETQEQKPIQNEAVENAKKDWGNTL